MKMKTLNLFFFNSVRGIENEIKVFLSFVYLGKGKLSSAFWLEMTRSKFTHSFMIELKELNLLEVFFFLM